MLIEANPYKVFAGSQGGALAKRICEYLGCEQGKVNICLLYTSPSPRDS